MRTIVGVLRGGPSSEYDLSLKTGAQVLQAFDRERYDARDIFIDRQGVWHQGGVPMLPARSLAGLDVVFNVVHGDYGEDGRLHRVLDALKVPYTGANLPTSILTYNKHHTRAVVKGLGIKMPHARVMERPEDVHGAALELFRSFPHPAIVKPVVGGPVYSANSFHGLESALERAWQNSPKILIEEYIPGRRAHVGLIEDFRGEKVYALLPGDRDRVPGLFGAQEKHALIDAARRVHEGLNLSHYSHVDFVVGKRGVYFLEASTATGVPLHSDSSFSRALHAVGVKLSHFVDHVIDLARRKKDE